MSLANMRLRSPEPISSPKNAWVQSVSLLAKSKERKASRAFLVEGEHAVLEAVQCKWPLDVIITTEKWINSHISAAQKLPRTIEIQLVSEAVLQKLATTEAPDGIMAIARMTSKLCRTADMKLAIACDRLQDPGNLGTLIRSAISVNCDGIFLSEDSVDMYNPKVIRSTAGQWFRKPPLTTSILDLVQKSREASIQVLAAASGGESYWSVDLTKPTLFLLGNEGAGLPDSLIQAADKTIAIPMANGVESLNVAMSGTLLLYEAFRQREARGLANK